MGFESIPCPWANQLPLSQLSIFNVAPYCNFTCSPPCRGDKFCAPSSGSVLGLGIGLPSIAFAPACAYLMSLGNGQHSHFLDILCMNLFLTISLLLYTS